jgi:maltooligosyltrehalose trehalohydrolase
LSRPAPALQDMELGAVLLERQQASFLVWAPFAESVDVHVLGSEQRRVPLDAVGVGYFRAIIDGVGAGTRYRYCLNGNLEFPDPTSRSQPEGVHGPSAIVETTFDWHDSRWDGVPLRDYILYELHVGAFTEEGTFDAVIPYLDYLVELGVTAVELMPVSQFPGSRNWGYDGVYPYAVQNSYGGPDGLKRLVDAAHGRGLAVVLDVVYNHLGPEGNYLGQFGPYFTDRYHTPWGLAVNFDGQNSPAVRRFVVENAVRWVSEFHIDALRLDAVHAIFDNSPKHILREIAEAVHDAGARLGRRIYVTAESDSNDSRLVERVEAGGHGLDAQWADDFHHSLHALLTGERSGYYLDFGSISDLAKSFANGFVFTGQKSEFRGAPRGTPAAHLPGERFVVCAQNHDQVGNRMLGERLTTLLTFEDLKLVAGVLLLSPFLPLLFMGEEWGETAPFLYFVGHSDADLIQAVRQGRSREFAAFAWQGEVPDPQAEKTFEQSRLHHSLRESGKHRVLLELYKELIRFRKAVPAIRHMQKEVSPVFVVDEHLLTAVRRDGVNEILLAFHFGTARRAFSIPASAGIWEKSFDSAQERWLGNAPDRPSRETADGGIRLEMTPRSFCVLQKITADSS